MNLEAILEALQTARPDGVRVSRWSLNVSDGRRISLGIKDRETGNAHAPLSASESRNGRYLLVWEDGLVSRGFIERKQLVEGAVQAVCDARAAAYDDPDAAQVLGPAEIPPVELLHPQVQELVDGDSTQMQQRLSQIRAAVDAAQVRTWSGSISAGQGRTRLVTSEGFDESHAATSFGWFVSINGETGDGFGARRLDADDEFTSRLERLLQLAREMETVAEPMEGAVRPVILHPRVVQSYVLGTLFHNLSGSTVAHDEGRFRRSQFGSGAPVLREDLTLRLDPLQPLLGGSYRFTEAGLPAARCDFIRDGRLVQPVLSLKYAKRLGLPPTPLPLGMDTVQLEGPEELDLPTAMKQGAAGALIPSVLGIHTQDSSSGDFSLAAPQALRLGDEGFRGKLRATISGNLFEVLSDPGLRLVRFEGETTPGLLFDCRLDPK